MEWLSEFIQFISLNLSEIERIEWLNEKQGAMNSLKVKNKPRRERSLTFNSIAQFMPLR